jgi:CheY-like chemotaxis protein
MAKILLIDDDARTLSLVQTLLEGQGHTVTCASSGDQGIKLVRSDAALDLIVTDMNMTGVSGWDVVRAIREQPSCADIPIMALSAFTSAQDRDEAFEAGCSAYENKPIVANRLLEKVTTLLAS